MRRMTARHWMVAICGASGAALGSHFGPGWGLDSASAAGLGALIGALGAAAVLGVEPFTREGKK
jgi:hypothetical protein